MSVTINSVTINTESDTQVLPHLHFDPIERKYKRCRTSKTAVQSKLPGTSARCRDQLFRLHRSLPRLEYHRDWGIPPVQIKRRLLQKRIPDSIEGLSRQHSDLPPVEQRRPDPFVHRHRN